MPPKAKATGVAALAEARAAFAGKARPQSAGLSTRGAEPQDTLPPSGPAPVATRRWIRGGWDADYYYDNKNAKEQGRRPRVSSGAGPTAPRTRSEMPDLQHLQRC